MCVYDECVCVHVMSVHVCVSIASFHGRLPLRFLDRIQGHVCGQENGVGDSLGMRLWFR